MDSIIHLKKGNSIISNFLNLCDELTMRDERGEEWRFVGAALCG
jgi:hypothetical protein